MSERVTGDASDLTYAVVVNKEGQYSIWATVREVPPGWEMVGVSGSESDCLRHIERVWTDMRPASLRVVMEQKLRESSVKPERGSATDDQKETLAVRLSRGSHAVELSLRPERTLAALIRQLETGWVHVRFTDTRGGTEFGVPVEPESLEQLKVQVSAGTGKVRLAGRLILDRVQVRCVANIDVATLAGSGRLEILS